VAEGADVTIRYAFLPTTSSIRESADKVVREFEGRMKKSAIMPSTTAAKKLQTETDKTIYTIINFLRATQLKTSLQTKIMAGLNLIGLGKKYSGGMSAEKMFPAGSTIMGGAKGAAAKTTSGGGMMGTLGTIASLLVGISVAMLLISAFFEAVGPFMKVVFKVLSAIILILLMPFLKRIMPFMAGFFKWLINVSQWIAKGVDKLLSLVEGLLGKAASGDPVAIIELLLGPIGIIAAMIGPKLLEIFSKIDWNAILTGMFDAAKGVLVAITSTLFGENFGERVNKLLTGIETALLGPDQDFWTRVGGVVNSIGTFVFGEETWTAIKDGITFIKGIFSPEGIWNSIKGVIDWIGINVFGKDLWTKIKDAIGELDAALSTEWANIISTLHAVAQDLNTILSAFGMLKPQDLPEPYQLGQLTAEKNREWHGVEGTFAVGQDFISRPGSRMQAFSPDDTIIGMKNPGALGGTTINNYLTVSAGVDRNEFRKILSDFNREQAKGMRSKTSYIGGVYA